MVLVAIAYNWPFAWRRYPAAFAPKAGRTGSDYPDIAHADLVNALAHIDSFIDISEQDLLRIYELATRRAQANGADKPPHSRP
jgi:CBS-domain-containing membrane protein